MQDSNLKPALPGALEGVGIDQKLDYQVPLDMTFRDEAGREVAFSTFFHAKKPVILALVYYRCPMLCTQILTGLVSSLKAVSFNPGRDFEVVSLSFDPKDTPELAAAKKATYLRRYGRPDTANGWHFLTGDERNIKTLTDAVGFHFKYDAATDQFAHASAILILTPDGRISRYFYGVEYAPRDIRLGLVEASARQDRQPGGRGAAVLLPLRPGHGEIRRHRHGRPALRRRGLRAGMRRVSGNCLPAGITPPQARRGAGRITRPWANYLYFRSKRRRSLPTWTTCCSFCWRWRRSSRC